MTTASSIRDININKEKEYEYGLDIIRFFAMYFVILFHSYAHNYYGQTRINTIALFFIAMPKYLSYSCNNLFILLTGYLKAEKRPTLSYYSKIISFIIEYLICSVVLITFRVNMKNRWRIYISNYFQGISFSTYVL